MMMLFVDGRRPSAGSTATASTIGWLVVFCVIEATVIFQNNEKMCALNQVFYLIYFTHIRTQSTEEMIFF